MVAISTVRSWWQTIISLYLNSKEEDSIVELVVFRYVVFNDRFIVEDKVVEEVATYKYIWLAYYRDGAFAEGDCEIEGYNSIISFEWSSRW